MFYCLSILRLTPIIMLVMFSNSFAQGSLDQRINELSQQISKEMSDYNKKKIAIIEFSDLDGNVTNFGKYVSEELITKLYLTKKFKVIERQLLNKIIAEQKLSLTGMIDPNSAKKLGKVLGVDAIVSGTIADLAQSLKVNARMLNTETGEIFAAASVEILKDESVSKLLSSATNNKSNLKTDNKPLNSSDKSTAKEFVYQNERIKITLLSVKKSGGIINITFRFENLETTPYGLWLWALVSNWGWGWGSGGWNSGGSDKYTYLLDENGERWDFRNETAGISNGVLLIPKTKLVSKFTFEAKGGKQCNLFNLTAKFDTTTETRNSGNPIEFVINDIPIE